MKRLILTLTAIFSLISFSFAADNINENVLKSFKSNFQNATEVGWSQAGNLYKAHFSLDGQYLAAFYEEDGTLIATTRNLTTIQLPLALRASLKEISQAYWVSELFELSDADGTSYYVTLENAETRLTMKAQAGSPWITYDKQRKS